jgi:CheY-like chemotaxis protein
MQDTATKERPHVLVVDDDEAIREAMRMVLEDAGYLVDEAPNGKQALERLRVRTQPMVVVLDLMMPGMDGRGVLETVAADCTLATRHAYLILTAREDKTLPLAFANLLSKLNVPIVGKPFDIGELVEAVAGAAARLPAS